MGSAILEVENFHKTFRIGFLRKRVEAARGVTFKVGQGEIFGLLGPNGAGKTTTLKAVLRLIYPTAGTIRLFGEPASRQTAARLGYLPENPYVYQYLKPLEFLDLCGRLMGMDADTRRKRAEEMVESVGLAHATDRPIGRFSKGMMQRIGLAQALLHDPELLILDEPMSGLDPIGRKQVRDIILAQRKAGKTLVFTSHILSDVEMLCDHVSIINRGKVVAAGAMNDLLRSSARRIDIELTGVSPELRESLEQRVNEVRMVEGATHLILEGEPDVGGLLSSAIAAGAHVVAVQPSRETLEDLFVREAMASVDDKPQGQPKHNTENAS